MLPSLNHSSQNIPEVSQIDEIEVAKRRNSFLRKLDPRIVERFLACASFWSSYNDDDDGHSDEGMSAYMSVAVYM